MQQSEGIRSGNIGDAKDIQSRLTESSSDPAATKPSFRFSCLVSATYSVDDQDMEITPGTFTYFRSPNYPDTATPVDAEATCQFTATGSTFQMSVFNSTSFLDDGASDDYELDVIGVPVSGSSITRRLMVADSTGGRPQRLNYTELVGVDLTRISVTYAQGQRNL